MLTDDRPTRHRRRLLAAAEQLSAGRGDEERDTRRRFLALVRQHGELFRLAHRTQYRALIDVIEDDEELLRLYADRLLVTFAAEEEHRV